MEIFEYQRQYITVSGEVKTYTQRVKKEVKHKITRFDRLAKDAIKNIIKTEMQKPYEKPLSGTELLYVVQQSYPDAKLHLVYALLKEIRAENMVVVGADPAVTSE